MTTDNFCFYLHNRLIQTSQTGGQQYNDTSPFCIPCSCLTRKCKTGLKKLARDKKPNLLCPAVNYGDIKKV